MIEIFKTNIQETEHASRLIHWLSKEFPDYKMNVDLSDCDKILRVENHIGHIKSDAVMDFVRQARIEIEILL